MKKIEAIIRKTKFEDVKEALLHSDITGLNIMMFTASARVVRSAYIVACSIPRM